MGNQISTSTINQVQLKTINLLDISEDRNMVGLFTTLRKNNVEFRDIAEESTVALARMLLAIKPNPNPDQKGIIEKTIQDFNDEIIKKNKIINWRKNLPKMKS